MELSPEEQSFFDTGDAISGPIPAVAEAPRRRRRHSRRHLRQEGWTRSRRKNWSRWTVSVVVGIGAVFAGYYFSMYVINRDIPNAADFGIGR